MILDTLISIDAKYKNLRLRKTVLNQRQRTVEYVFSYPSALSKNEKDEITNTVHTLSPQGLAISIEFELDDYNASSVKKDVIRQINAHYPSLSARNELKIECKAVLDAIKVKLSADDVTCGIIEANNLIENLTEYFAQTTTAHVVFELDKYEKNVDKDELWHQVESFQQLQISIQMSKPKRFFEVTDTYKLIGREITASPRYIIDVNSPSKSCTICGKVRNKKSFPSKKPDLYVCKMELVDETGAFPIILFAKTDAYRKYSVIEDGDELIINGPVDVNSYSGQLELKAYNVSKCRILPPENTEIKKPVPDKYITVSPQKYHDSTQLNLLAPEQKPCDFLKNHDVVVFDFETTGLKVLQDTIIEIGAVKIHNGQIAETFSTFVNPERELSKVICELTGITDEMLVGQPIFAEVVGDFYKFSHGCVMVAHNLEFDQGFLKYYSAPSGYVFDNQSYDTIEMMRKLITSRAYRGKKPANYKLITVAKALDLPIENLHRALDDATLTAKAVLKMLACEPNLL